MLPANRDAHAKGGLQPLDKRRREAMAKDPMCGMQVDEKTATRKSAHKGQTYYFCSPGCKKSFDKEPEKYVGGRHEHGEQH